MELQCYKIMMINLSKELLRKLLTLNDKGTRRRAKTAKRKQNRVINKFRLLYPGKTTHRATV